MPTRPVPAARLRLHLAALAGSPSTDADLLDRYVTARDEAAFAELVRRHGPAVLAVCRRITRDREDAEDAFQATFLVLARKADRVRPGSAVGGAASCPVLAADAARLAGTSGPSSPRVLKLSEEIVRTPYSSKWWAVPAAILVAVALVAVAADRPEDPTPPAVTPVPAIAPG